MESGHGPWVHGGGAWWTRVYSVLWVDSRVLCTLDMGAWGGGMVDSRVLCTLGGHACTLYSGDGFNLIQFNGLISPQLAKGFR